MWPGRRVGRVVTRNPSEIDRLGAGRWKRGKKGKKGSDGYFIYNRISALSGFLRQAVRNLPGQLDTLFP